MDAGGWLELAASVLGLGVFAALVAAEEALAHGDLASATGTEDAGTALAWLRRRPRRTSIALLLYKDLALVGVAALLAALLLSLVAPIWWAILLAVLVTLVLGFFIQLAVRYYAFHHAREVMGLLGGPVRFLVLLAYPLIWALRSLPGSQRERAAATQSDAGAHGRPPLSAGEPERRMIRGIIGLSQTTVREVMVPRMDMVAVDKDTPLDEVVKLVQRQGYSRLPVYEESVDNVVGVIHVKDLLPLVGQQPVPPVTKVARPPYFIPESKRIDECLEEFQRHRVHMAIVVDEYGGVAGLVTMEDVIEEIVGEIGDEFRPEEPQIKRLNENEVAIDGRVSIADINEALGLSLPSEEFDTIGGLVLTHLGHIPSPGETMEAYGVQISVLSTLGRRVRQVKLAKKSEQATATSQPWEVPSP